MVNTESLLTNYIQKNFGDVLLNVEITYDCPPEEQRQQVSWDSGPSDVCAEEILSEIWLIQDLFDGLNIEVCINDKCITDDDYIADKILYEN